MRTALLAGATAAGFAFAPAAAGALTAAEAWAEWQRLAAENDAALTAAGETAENGRLTVSSVAFASELEDDTTVTGTIAEIVFTETGDGTVEVTMSETIPITVSGTSEAGEALTAAATLTQQGFVYRATDGEDGGLAAEYAADEMALALDSVELDGELQSLRGTVTVGPLEGIYAASGGDPVQLQSSARADGLEMAFAGTDPESGGVFDITVSMEDIVSESESTGASIYAMGDDVSEMIEDGFAGTATGSVGPVAVRVLAEGMPESIDLGLDMAGGAGSVTMDAERLAYDVAYDGIDFALSGSEIPVPEVSGSLGEWRTRISLPAVPSDEAAPAGLTLALRDLALGESVWSMFDPSGTLPRDPATLVIDLAGRLRLLQDIFAEDAGFAGGPPAEVESLDISELRLSLAGAELSGEGAFTFDTSGGSQFGAGMPPADGTLNLRLTGGQTLLDRLVQMGLLGQEEATMARMMTGMIARPGSGPDELVSEITVRPDGTVLANGAPLPF